MVVFSLLAVSLRVVCAVEWSPSANVFCILHTPSSIYSYCDFSMPPSQPLSAPTVYAPKDTSNDKNIASLGGRIEGNEVRKMNVLFEWVQACTMHYILWHPHIFHDIVYNVFCVRLCAMYWWCFFSTFIYKNIRHIPHVATQTSPSNVHTQRTGWTSWLECGRTCERTHNTKKHISGSNERTEV